MKGVPDLRRTYADIYLNHLRHNCRLLQSLVPIQAFFCPMVKANAYGHGDVSVVRALLNEGVNAFGLALIEEGISLREQGIDRAQLLIFGNFEEEGVKNIIDYQLTPVLWSWTQIELLEKALPPSARFPVHVKFNAGMYRLGFSLAEASRLANYFRGQDRLQLHGLCTHLSDAEDFLISGGRTQRQLDAFARATQEFSGWPVVIHVYNSSGLLGAHLSQKTAPQWGVRPGIALYGVKPPLQTDKPEHKEFYEALDLRPVMTLSSEIIAYHEVPAGDGVSYNWRWKAEKPSMVGTVAVGYADGYHRLLTNVGQMTYRDHRVPVVGTICMDYTLVDLTSVLGVKEGLIGERIVLFGSRSNELHVSELATVAQTIPYELLTSVSRRVPRRFIED